MGGRELTIDLDVVEANAGALVTECATHGIAVTGVTKAVCGHPEVAAAMLRAGVTGLGESRVENIARLREAGIDAPITMLRVPSLSYADSVVELADLSLNSEVAVLEALSAAALARSTVHEVVVMVDLGDLREGVWPDEVPSFLRRVAALAGVRVVGLGANLACFGGVAPTTENMGRLVELVEAAEADLGRPLPMVSAGNSSALALLAAGGMPARATHLRLGEAILLGRETVERRPWPGTRQDGARLHAEVIERRRKPSVPSGPVHEDAFGHHPEFVDRGWLEHALVNVGRVDVDVDGLCPLDPGVRILGASSDYLVLDVTGAGAAAYPVGAEVVFDLGYGALVTAMSSPYVHHRVLGGPQPR